MKNISIGELEKKPLENDDKAMKFDYGKLRYDLIPYDCIEKLTEVYTFGASKYQSNNWRKGMKWSRLYRATFSHLFSSFRGEDIDEDSSLLHLSQVIWNCNSLLHYLLNNIGEDDRYKDISIKKELMIKECDFTKQIENLWIKINERLKEKNENKTPQVNK